MKIIEYQGKYLNDIRDLLTELEEYIVMIVVENLLEPINKQENIRKQY